MKTAVASLQSVSPYSQSRHYDLPKLEKESADAYEKRTWRERCHVTDDGHIFIPPMAFKLSLSEAAKFMGEKIPGKRNATWTKHFEAGVLVMEGPTLDIKKDAVEGEWLFMNADGVRGSGKRVMKCYPKISEWKADVTFYILDETITQAAFEKFLKEAGNFIGIGRFRPRMGGFYGRFSVAEVKWLDS